MGCEGVYVCFRASTKGYLFWVLSAFLWNQCLWNERELRVQGQFARGFRETLFLGFPV